VRHGRAYRDIFQIVRAQLLGENHLDDAPDLPHDPGVDV
jgi:hypothetical protein